MPFKLNLVGMQVVTGDKPDTDPGRDYNSLYGK